MTGRREPALFARLISHQPAVLFSQNEPATSNQPQPASSTFLSEQTSTSHQPPANRTGSDARLMREGVASSGFRFQTFSAARRSNCRQPQPGTTAFTSSSKVFDAARGNGPLAIYARSTFPAFRFQDQVKPTGVFILRPPPQ
jgi:hypothetical protein